MSSFDAGCMMSLSRPEIMSRIRSRDTTPELTVRSAVHKLGFRFRLHRRDLPGTPDLVFPGLRAVIFVHGCFWHHHPHCPRAFVPATRTKYWLAKFARSIERDADAAAALKAAGWKVLTVWKCELKRPNTTTRRIGKFLRNAAIRWRRVQGRLAGQKTSRRRC